MLTADQITALGDKAQTITDPIVEFLIEDIARRVSEAGQLTSTASYQVWRLQNLGLSQQQIQKEIQKRLNVSAKEVEQLMTQAAEVGYNFDLKNLPHADAVSFAENEVIQQIVGAAVQMAQDDLSNMVQTLGFVNHDGVSRPLTEAYQQACDFAFQKVAMGAQDYNSAIRQATKGLAERGIVSIDYESGRSTSIEAAVRRNIMSALGTMQEQISQQNHDDLGCDGWEISAHGASAPDHEPIQGKQYTDAKYTALNNALVRRIGTLNCGHAAFPIILGVNEPQYSASELERFRQANEKGIDYEGKHYTMYEATQRQRKLERSIRNRKRRILIDQTTGDKERLAIDQTRLVILNDEYARFSKAAGLRSQRERTNVAGFGAKEAREAGKAAKQAKTEDVAAIFELNEKYRTPEGKFDLEQAKKDYEEFLTTVPEKNRIYLQQSFESVQYCCDETKANPYGYAFNSDPKKNIVADTLYYNPSHPEFWHHPFKETVTHELAHRIDNFFARSMDTPAFLKAITDAKKTIDADPKKFAKYCREHDADGFLSDILSAITGGERRYVAGHLPNYWKETGSKEKEVFANLFSLEALQKTDELAFIRDNFPEIMRTYGNLEY